MSAAPPREVRAYLDHASVSPLRPEVIAALGELVEVAQVDPGRPYEESLVVRGLIEDARSSLASLLGVTPRQVVFTSSIPESVTTAIASLAAERRVLASPAERSSVLAAAERSSTLVELAVDEQGRLDLVALEHELEATGPALVCCQVANHETGARSAVDEIVERSHRRGALVHVDATMALGWQELDLDALGADAMTVSSELIGGPMGCAALIVGRDRLLTPLIPGGTQERARRAGLENLLGIVGMGIAVDALGDAQARLAEAERARGLIEGLESAATAVEGVAAIGPSDPAERIPNVRCFTIERVEAEPVVMGLDRAGISVHSGSACSSESLEPSPVLAAMGLDAARSLRLSVGWSSTDDDVARFADRFGDVVGSLRALGR